MSLFIRTMGFSAGSVVMAFALSWTLLTTVLSGPALSSDYVLGVSDRVRIKVVDWQTTEATARNWDAIDGEYSIGAAGTLSLPLIGETPASGKTTAEVAAQIEATMQQSLALIVRPHASVEITRYRPFFIYGAVQNPGEYPYAPSLTVMRALSIAGGTRRSGDFGMRIERDLINARFNYNLSLEERNRLLARRARLVAELENRERVDVPAELAGNKHAERLMADEEAIFLAGKSRLAISIASFDNLRKLYDAEIVTLEKKSVSQDRQLQLAKAELGSVNGLAERGLVVNQRVLAIERTISDLESRILDLGTQSLRAKQELVKADQEQDNLFNSRKTEITTALQTVQADLGDVTMKVALYGRLVEEALSVDPAAGTATGKVEFRYKVTRGTGTAARSFDVNLDTEVQPGDVIEVISDVRSDGQ